MENQEKNSQMIVDDVIGQIGSGRLKISEALQHLEIVKAKPGLFNEWLKSKGKLGGQHKIPRLSNSRKNIDEMLMMNK